MPSALSDLCSLRDAIARIEGLGTIPDGVRGACFAPGPVTANAYDNRFVPLGEDALPLDDILGGGIRRGTLHEIVAESPRDEAAASGFAVALAALCAIGEMLVWIVDDRAAWETGTPYRPGLMAHGLRPDKLILVKTKDTHTTLWATEEALRAGAPVVVTELWRAKTYDLTASRRLLLAARRKGATSLLVHVGLNRADEVSSGAETRFSVAALPSAHQPSAGHRTPIPGMAGFAIRLTKLRGTEVGGMRGFDRDQVHNIFWNPARRCFRLPASSYPPWPTERPEHDIDYGRGDAA
jgi:protein ImuA